MVDLYNGLRNSDDARVVHAYETWGFKKLSRELIDILNIWARFIYGPLMDDRVRSIADGVKPGDYGRRQAFEVHKALREKGPVTVPREFVLMDRAAIGLGGVFLHLRAELNFHRLFEAAMENFSVKRVADRQAAALKARRPRARAARLFHRLRAAANWPRGLPVGIRLMGQGVRPHSSRMPAAAIPLGLPLRSISQRRCLDAGSACLLCRPGGFDSDAARGARGGLRRARSAS